MINKSSRNTIIGNITITEKEGFIIGIEFTKEKYNDETDLINKTFLQLEEYFDKKRKEFDTPIKMKGTDFQLKVWNELKKIPYGKTVSYQELAIKLGVPKGARAIGNANNKNKILIVIPCHRVIGKNGKLVGFAGGLNIKEKLLEIEK